MTPLERWFQYLPVSAEEKARGFYIYDAGHSIIPPGAPYPPPGHPEDFHFTWQKGRTLPQYHLIYIPRGKGLFESRLGGKKNISEGSCFILFPGEWHRYRPDKKTGWEEYWIGLAGDRVEQFLPLETFHPRHPVLSIGLMPRLIDRYLELADIMRKAEAGYSLRIAALGLQIIAEIQHRTLAANRLRDQSHHTIQRAKHYLASRNKQTVDIRTMARDLHVGYSWLRHTFRKKTGMSPKQYHLQLRINRAGYLLLNTSWKVKDIAEDLGFENHYYFMRLFRQKCGCTPSEWRKQNGP